MDQLLQNEHRSSSFKYPLIQIKRILRAPITEVWKAWSSADLIKQWYGPEGFTCPSARILFREGGRYLIGIQSPQQKVTWSTGIYEQIIPLQKIVCSDQGTWTEKCYVTIEFEECNRDQTQIIVTQEGVPREMYEDCCQGWMSSLDKLKRVIEKN